MKKRESVFAAVIAIFIIVMCLTVTCLASGENKEAQDSQTATEEQAVPSENQEEAVEEADKAPETPEKKGFSINRVFTGFFIMVMAFLMFALITADKKLKK